VSEQSEVIAASGTSAAGDSWTLLYRPEGDGGRHHIALLVNGRLREEGSGLDIPDTTEIGFGSGVTPGSGEYYLYGLTSSRIHTVRAESHSEEDTSEVATTPLPETTATVGDPLRAFVLTRPPVENVIALVGLDSEGRIAQRIPFT
jgi:hypothetical protein